jgi:hypothetical protein
MFGGAKVGTPRERMRDEEMLAIMRYRKEKKAAGLM